MESQHVRMRERPCGGSGARTLLRLPGRQGPYQSRTPSPETSLASSFAPNSAGRDLSGAAGGYSAVRDLLGKAWTSPQNPVLWPDEFEIKALLARVSEAWKRRDVNLFAQCLSDRLVVCVPAQDPAADPAILNKVQFLQTFERAAREGTLPRTHRFLETEIFPTFVSNAAVRIVTEDVFNDGHSRTSETIDLLIKEENRWQIAFAGPLFFRPAAYIEYLAEEEPGNALGLQIGDIILSYAGTKIPGPLSFFAQAERDDLPSPRPLQVIRNGRLLSYQAPPGRLGIFPQTRLLPYPGVLFVGPEDSHPLKDLVTRLHQTLRAKNADAFLAETCPEGFLLHRPTPPQELIKIADRTQLQAWLKSADQRVDLSRSTLLEARACVSGPFAIVVARTGYYFRGAGAVSVNVVEYCARKDRWYLLAQLPFQGIGVNPNSTPITENTHDLVPNGSFEDAADNLPVGWTFDADSCDPFYPAWGFAGFHCVGIRSQKGGSGHWARNIAVEAGKTYRLSGWIQTQAVKATQDSGAFLEVKGHAKTPVLRGDQSWTRVEATFKTADERQVLARCVMGGSGPITGTAWFDSITLETPQELPVGKGRLLSSGMLVASGFRHREGGRHLLMLLDPTNAHCSTLGAIRLNGRNIGPVTGLCFSPDGTLYGYDTGTDSIIALDPSTGEAASVVHIGRDLAWAGLACHPSGNLYWGDMAPYGGLFQFNPATRTLKILGLRGASDIDSLAWDPTGRMLMMNDGLLYQLDLDTGTARPLGKFPGSLAFSARGELLCTQSASKEDHHPARLAKVDPKNWTITPIAELVPDEGPLDVLNAIAFVP